MSIEISFLKTRAIPLAKDEAKVLITWELKTTLENLSDYEFYVDRSDAQDQLPAFQWVDIDRKPIEGSLATTDSNNTYQISMAISALDFYEYVDYSGALKNLYKQQYYRIRCRKISTQEEMGSAAFTWDGDLDLVGMYVVDEHNFLLRDVIGIPCLVYQRKRGGIPCNKCYDPVQKKRKSSFCVSCFGTNWEGGFYKPIDLYIDFSPNPNSNVIQEWGETQDNQTNILLSNYPIILPGDIIRELREMRLWRVTRVQQTEKRRVPMLQFAQVVELKPGDVEYRIPMDEELVKQKVEELEITKQRREF